MTQNFRFAWRNLRRSHTYTATAVGSLALGIGGAVAMFAIVHTVLWKALPYQDPGRLVRIVGAARGFTSDADSYLLSPQQFERWRNETKSLAKLTVFRPGAANLTGIAEAQQVSFLRVSAEFFSTLGFQPQLGRWLTVDEETDLTVRRAVLSDGLWRSAYGASRDIIGKPIYLDGIAYEVVGVASPDYWLPGGQDVFPMLPRTVSVFLPLQIPAGHRTGQAAFFYYAIGRLAPGASPAQAAAELTANPAPVTWTTSIPAPDSIQVQPLQEKIVQRSQGPLLLLLGAVLFLLLIVCVNVGSLTIARWEHDRRGLAIRTSLGASWWQIAALCLSESALLAAAGTGLGILLAWWLAGMVQAAAGTSLPRMEFFGMNGVVVIFGVAAGAGSALLIGLLPAVRFARQSSQWEQGLASRGGTETGGARALQRALVSVQTAIAVVLLCGAVLFLMSLQRLLSIPDGYDADRVVTAKIIPSRNLYPGPADRQLLADRLIDTVGRIPGVAATAVSTVMPNDVTWKLNVETEQTIALKQKPGAYYLFVTKAYFDAMGIPLLDGQIPEDRLQRERQVTISLAAAKALFPGVNPIGRTVQNGVGGPPERVVAVVGDVRPEGLDQPPTNIVYRNFQLTHFGGDGPPQMFVLIRTNLTGSALAGEIRRAVSTVDPGLAVSSVQTLRQIPRPEVSLRQLQAALTTGFGTIGLILAAAGVYGVVAFSLARRRKELAIRMALGAGRAHIRGIVWKEAITPVLWGLIPGLVAAVGLGPLLRGLLFGVSPTEPLVLTLTPLILLASAMVPAFFLSRRAAQIEPATVMQSE